MLSDETSRLLRKFITGLVFLLLCLLHGVGQNPNKRMVTGRLLGIDGEWQRKGTTDLIKIGDAVSEGDVITPHGEADDLYISIGLLNGDILGCDSRHRSQCNEIKIPSLTGPATNWSARIIQAFDAIISQRTPPTVFMLARGVGPNPNEAVLRFSNGKLDVSPALRDIETGNYTVFLTDPDAKSSTGAIKGNFHWAGTGSCEVRVHPLAGIYGFQVATSTGDHVGSSVTVLVTDQATFKQASDNFHDAYVAAEPWKKQMRPTTWHYVLSVYLYDLFRKNAGSSSGMSDRHP